MSASAVTSPTTARPPIARATSPALALSRSKTTIWAPADASRRQMASPMPRPPPVTRATRSSSRKNESLVTGCS